MVSALFHKLQTPNVFASCVQRYVHCVLIKYPQPTCTKTIDRDRRTWNHILLLIQLWPRRAIIIRAFHANSASTFELLNSISVILCSLWRHLTTAMLVAQISCISPRSSSYLSRKFKSYEAKTLSTAFPIDFPWISRLITGLGR